MTDFEAVAAAEDAQGASSLADVPSRASATSAAVLVSEEQLMSASCGPSRAMHEPGVDRRFVLDHAPEAFIAIDARGLVIDRNAQAQHTFGWSAQEAIGRSLGELIIPSRYQLARPRCMPAKLTIDTPRALTAVTVQVTGTDPDDHLLSTSVTRKGAPERYRWRWANTALAPSAKLDTAQHPADDDTAPRGHKRWMMTRATVIDLLLQAHCSAQHWTLATDLAACRSRGRRAAWSS